jgi:hypothetical protein
MVSAVVDPQSGELATDWCPTRTRQWYKPGSEPTEQCHLHTGPPEGQIAVDAGDAQSNDARNDPIGAVGRSLGKLLRKIIRW